MLELVSSIPSGSDSETIFEKDGIVPYYGVNERSSHYWLKVLQSLGEHSPSLTAIKDSIRTYVFGAGIDVGKKVNSGFYPNGRENVETDVSLKQLYVDDLVISPKNILQSSSELFDSEFDSGNSYLKITITVNDSNEVKVEAKPIHYTQAAYWKKKKGTIANSLIVSKKWDNEYLKRNTPEYYPVTNLDKEFNWRERTISATGTKVYQTVIHKKRKADNSDYYGRPKILSILDWVYTELNYGTLVNKISNSETVSKLLLAFEKPDSNGTQSANVGFRRLMDSVVRLVTNKGVNSASVAGIEYPKGSKEPKPIKIDVNRDIEYQTKSIDTARDLIYSRLGWSPVLTARERPSSSMASNSLIDTYLTFNNAKIIPLQREYSDYWNFVIDGINEKIGREKSDLGIIFNSLMSQLIDDLKQIKGGNNNQ